MKQFTLAESFLADDRELSFFDVVLPLFKMTDRGVLEALLGSCFPIGIGGIRQQLVTNRQRPTFRELSLVSLVIIQRVSE